MSTVNFKKSEYITLAIKPLDAKIYITDPHFIEWAENIVMDDHGNSTVEALAWDTIYRDYERIRDLAKTIIDDYDLNLYELHVIPGYEESLSIDIENNLPAHFDTYKDKQAAQKEVTRLKKCLVELVNECGFLECFPYWCTGYSSKKETLQGIDHAIKLIRKEIEITETERQVNKRLLKGTKKYDYSRN